MIAALNGTGDGVYHVSSGSDYAIKELFDAVVEAMGIELEEEVEVRPRPPEDAPSILLDPSRTEADFGWKAKVPLARASPRQSPGIARTEWARPTRTCGPRS